MGQGRLPIIEAARAKLNLYLHITGRRPDGYHELDTLFAFVDFGDRLTISAADKFSLTQDGDLDAQLPAEDQNLVWQAAHALAVSFGIVPTGHIHLEKYIPVASGLGGGSADAAAALRGLCQIWELPVDDSKVMQVAQQLGADVPACLGSTASLATGIGDLLEPLSLPSCGVVLVNPMISLATPLVFQAWRDSGAGFSPAHPPQQALTSYDHLLECLGSRHNDLESAAISQLPVIADILAALRGATGCALARMSGSGASCFGLFQTSELAIEAARNLSALQPKWWVKPATLNAPLNAPMGQDRDPE